MLQALSINLKAQGVNVVFVSVDDPKDEPKALSFLKDNGITLKSYLVDGSGELVHFWGGEAFENEIVPVVENFLGGRAIQPETSYGLAPGKVEP